MSQNDLPGWTDDGALSFAPEPALAFAPQPMTAPRAGPWSPAPAVESDEAETAKTALYWPWRLGIGLAQGFAFYLLFRARADAAWPGSDVFLFDAIALPLLFIPWALMAGFGRVALPRLLVFAALAAAMLAALGWYHRWRIFGVDHGEPGISLLLLSALALFLAQSLLEAWDGGWRMAYPVLFRASWTLAARLAMLLLVAALGLALVHLLPHLSLERGDILSMPFLGLCGGLAFQLTAALPRFTTALTSAALATATVLLPLAVGATILILCTTLAGGPPPLAALLVLASGLSLTIGASWRDGGPRRAWREGFEMFGALLLPLLAALAVWVLAQRVMALGWTSARLFAAAWLALLCATGIAYAAAALTGLVRGHGLKGLGTINTALAGAALLGALALASPLGDPLRLAPASQAARLEQGRVAVEKFDFASLAQSGTRFGADALAALSHSLYPDIAHAAQTVRGPAADLLNPTEIGANIAVHTPGGRLPATLLARDWSHVAGVPPCLTAAAQSCEAFFLDLNDDRRPEILLVTGGEARWWGAVMEEDAAGRWSVAGRLAAGCGATLSDLRAGRFSVLRALPGWGDLSVAGTRLSVTPSGTGCSHY